MMRPADAFGLAVGVLGEHKLRTTLTMLGMTFGVGAVIAMLSIGAGAESEALSLIDRLGTRNIVVRGKDLKKEELEEARKKSMGLSSRDVEAVLEAVPGVTLAAPKLEVDPYEILAAGAKTKAKVLGVSYQQASLTHMALVEGRFLDARDEAYHAQSCVIGAAVRRDLFGAGPALGRDVKINGLWLEVVGVLAPDAVGAAQVEGLSVSSSEREIYLPFTTALRKLDRDPLKAPLSEIVVHLAPGVAARETATVIGVLLDRLHGGVADYEIVVPEALLEQSRQTQRLFNLVMGLIAGISLLVGGIGIMNIMLASVLEQTREIGIRRAVGARRKDIRVQFLFTAFTLALLGGLTGVVIGLGISRGVAAYAGWPTVVTAWSIVLSLAVSVTVGVVSGLFPAVRAARLDPVEALRYE